MINIRPDPSEEERDLREILDRLRQEYERRAKPYIDRLAAIESLRPPPRIFMTIEQARALGLLPGDEAHHPWCNYSSAGPASACDMCKRFNAAYPLGAGSVEDLVAEHFPDAVVRDAGVNPEETNK